MKGKNEISNLISSYLNKSISEDEFNQLQIWINKSPENKKRFTEYLKVYKTSRNIELLERLDKDLAWNKIVSKIKRPLNKNEQRQPSKIKYLKFQNAFFKYAAIIVLMVGVGYYLSQKYLFVSNQQVIPQGSIVLEMEDGTLKILSEDGNEQLVDGSGNTIGEQNGQQLNYSKAQKKAELVYNTLTIPYGKRFSLKLSDGTTVYLNSGTSLKYPIKFIEGHHRKVFLTGEAYFDVAKDAEHPFVVASEHIDVKVLGTVFNVSAYPEDASADVVLIEGSVRMAANGTPSNQEATLVPGTKGSLNKTSENILTEKVDTAIYTSWIQGELFFRNMPFENIVKKLERHYDRKIVIQNKDLKSEIFNASFKEEPIENVLSYFKDSFNIKYHTENNIIYIN